MVKFENVEIRYGKFVAIENLNLDIKEGEFFTFLGPSGCGKTTSLRALVGFIHPSKGKVYINGQDVTNYPVEDRNVGMVFQSYALFPTMTVYENIAFGMKVKKMRKEEIDRKVREIAKKIKITDEQLAKNVSELSGGQQQRVALARAIVLEPKILCLDEPLSNLDAKLRINMRLELKRLQKELGITTLYVTHDQEEALTLSDRIAVFNNGYVEQVGTPYEIYNKSQSEFVCDFIGDINKLGENILNEINRLANSDLNVKKSGFIRIEQCLSENKGDQVKLVGTVSEVEFNGVLTKYTLECLGETIKYLEKNDGYKLYGEGDQIEIYINPKDIMQF
ncbi:ABC transporter ATP-binding protein [Lachnospiraceae bacterium oral taxon 500]|nr:ABC transporter ATP-binding protein [Lachnospiraceae bacterium oral taxon 500]